MSMLRTQSFFLFSPVLLVSLISIVISASQAQLVSQVPRSTTSPSPVLVNDVVYSMNHRSTVTMDISSFLSSPTPTRKSATMAEEVLGAVRVDVSVRDDTAPSSESTISLSGLDWSTTQPPQPVSTLLLSSATSISPEPSTATSHDNSVPLSAIVGGAVGGCVVLIAFIAFVFITRRQRGPHIEPYRFEPDVERHRPEENHRRQMNQRSPPASDVPIIRPPTRRQNQPPSAHPLLHPGTKVPALYDLKVSVSATSLHSTLVPETPAARTFSRNRDGDAASVISHASSDRRRPRPLPRPPTDKPPPVPALPIATHRDANNSNTATMTQAQARPALAVLPTASGQSLASSASPLSPASPLDIDLGDYANPGTSPQTLSPARRDSQLEPSLVALRSPRRLPAPPVQSPPAPRACTASRDRDGERGEDVEMEREEGEGEGEAREVEGEAGPYFGLSFDAEGRPDSPSVAKMYAELLELQRQVARLREDMPGAGRGFGDAPPEYAESVVGSVVGSVCV